MFTLKKIIGGLAMPLPMILLTLIAAALLWKCGRQSLAKGMLAGAALSLYLLSISPVAVMIAAPLEFAHPPYQQQPVDAVVVLGGYHQSDERKPVTSLLSSASMVRLSEGVRVYRQNPGARLYLSGYGPREAITNAEAMAKVALAMGVPLEDITLEPAPRDTREEAIAWGQRLQGQKIALVTSAMHMPRALFLFEQEGMQPVPAPTNFRTGKSAGYRWQSWLPKASTLSAVESAWHEYLGLMWAKLIASGSDSV